MSKTKKTGSVGPLFHELYLSVYDGQFLIGYLVSRRRGVEAYDLDSRSLGIHRDQKTAAAAIGARYSGMRSASCRSPL